MKKVFIVLILLIFSFVFGCISNETALTINEIKNNHSQYSDKEVILEGTVSQVVSTINTPPVAGAMFGTQTFLVNDGTDEILIRIVNTEIDESLKVKEAVAHYNGQESDKVMISEGDSLRVSGVVEVLPDAVEQVKITVKASKIEKI